MQGALTWLEETQDKPLDELKASVSKAADDDEEEGGPSVASLEGDETAQSLVCNECGKKFRSNDAASFHASKT